MTLSDFERQDARGKIFRRIYIVTTESDEIWYGNTFRAGSYFYGINHDPIPNYGNVNGNLQFPVNGLVNQLLVYGSNYGLYTVVVGKTASSGWGCTRRRQLLTARRTGWTAIRRHIGGGAMESRTTMYSASATHLKVSKTESAQASTGTPAKFLIVSNQLTGLCLPFMNMIVIVIIIIIIAISAPPYHVVSSARIIMIMDRAKVHCH